MDSALIQEPILNHLASVEKVLKQQVPSNVGLSVEILRHLIHKPGKRFRPSILLLAALSLKKRVNNQAYFAAASVELLHNASLIHDDIVDQATTRRGLKSANKIWGDHATVLAGDYLLAKSLYLVNQCKNHKIMGIVTNSASELANGQILDIMLSKRLIPFNKKIYFKMIKLKTASLVSASAQVGAVLGSNNDSEVNSFKSYGINLGISYQLMDDALDLISTSKKMGKSTMEDLKEGKVTLPILASLANSSASSSKKAEAILVKKKFDRKSLDFLYNFVLENNGIEDTVEVARKYSKTAISKINFLPDSKYKASLIRLAQDNLIRMS
ncbi:polyprenyl synthetase family protein [bacterium]|jgi:octaprenyl-diphosphate synthase|nr:polyprenyl synthetase family protein [bacterium]MBT3850376.1 polyprenyl synthetase family protein [bacterium]MBT4634236.1 polyprenyl synthetase family protein [bacterium]MDG2445775.1 polyprenyl synthetase family protein [Thermodesulfobacteriota bacterium]|tara:strand:- start:3436 stop:4416 length:981 start_codon:yes stop_codon:yes gene_type:complete